MQFTPFIILFNGPFFQKAAQSSCRMVTEKNYLAKRKIHRKTIKIIHYAKIATYNFTREINKKSIKISIVSRGGKLSNLQFFVSLYFPDNILFQRSTLIRWLPKFNPVAKEEIPTRWKNRQRGHPSRQV